jgi:hypothetical protein
MEPDGLTDVESQLVQRRGLRHYWNVQAGRYKLMIAGADSDLNGSVYGAGYLSFSMRSV